MIGDDHVGLDESDKTMPSRDAPQQGRTVAPIFRQQKFGVIGWRIDETGWPQCHRRLEERKLMRPEKFSSRPCIADNK